jgi:hypothetical protein
MARVKLDDPEKEALKRIYKYKCYICEKQDFPKYLSIDHVIPPNKIEQAILEGYITDDFGVDSIYNYAPICVSCNRKKSDKLYPKNHCLDLLFQVRNKVPEIIKLANKLKEEIKESQILFQLNLWEKSGYLENTQVYNCLSAFIQKRMDFGFGNSIILKPTENTQVKLFGQKSLNDNDIDTFLQKLQISQEMVFGYGNHGFIELENEIYFYPVSISTIPPIPFYSNNIIFNLQTQIHAILLRDKKAVLISISKIDLQLDIKEKYKFQNYTENQFLFDNIDTQKQHFGYLKGGNTIIRNIQGKIGQLNIFSKTVLQYIIGLFGVRNINE